MSILYWKLPWAGPRLDGAGWGVMPDPALGNARGLCVAVYIEGGKAKILLPDEAGVVDTAEALLGLWTRLPEPQVVADGYLCILGYDQTDVAAQCGTYVMPKEGKVLAFELRHAVDELLRGLDSNALAQILTRPEAPPPPEEVTIAFGSCQYPPGLMDGVPSQKSYERLANRLDDQTQRRPSRLLLLGDQIYADATAGLLDPLRVDDRYRLPYEELMHMEPLRRIMRRIPIEWMLDDHEIEDNWEPSRAGTGEFFDRGVAAFWLYQRMRAQPLVGPAMPMWYTEAHSADCGIFMADTRSSRQLRYEGSKPEPLILGEVQTAALEAWLLQQRPTALKIIASPAMLLPRQAEHVEEPLQLDGWQGYPESLHRLLAFLCDNQIRNVCFLSGDAHLACWVWIAITNQATGKGARARSIHAPALYGPLPFANEQPWNLKLVDRFTFDRPNAGRYTCVVRGKAFLPRGDGSCLLKADWNGTSWKIDAEVI